MEQIIEAFLSEAHAYAESSKRTYTGILTLFLDQVADPQQLTAAGLLRFIQDQTGWESVEGNARQCVAFAACKKFLAWRYGSQHPALNAKLKRIRGKIQPTITDKQKNILLASFDRHTPKGARDLAIATLWIQSALRLSEIIRLKQEHVDTEHGICYALVKGGKWRYAIFTADTSAHLEHWKRFREELQPEGGLLFVTLQGAPFKDTGLRSVVREWGKKIDVKLTPHMFRRGMATISAENGANSRSVMLGAGWSSEQMFNHYTRQFQLEALRRFLPDTKITYPPLQQTHP